MKLRRLFALLFLLTTACVSTGSTTSVSTTGSATPAVSTDSPNAAPPKATATVSTSSTTGVSTTSPQPTAVITVFPTLAVTTMPLPLTRQTPMTLMLHRSNANFDAVAFLRDFIALVQQNNLDVVTYREIAKNPDLTATEQSRLVIFTIDDIYLRYPMDPTVKEMIALLKAANFPAVLGLITESDYAYPETVTTLKELTGLGWEVASHSDTHRNLREIQKIAPKAIYPEIKTSLDKLEAALGQRPITLILPEGQMTQGDQQLKRTGVLWIVGINGGTTYAIDATYYYVGREGPDGNAATTFAAMRKRFAP